MHFGVRLGSGPAAHRKTSVLRTSVFALGAARRLIDKPPCYALRCSPWERPGGSQQMLDAVLLFLQLLQREVDALLAEGVDRQPFDDLVFAAGRGDRVAEHHL